MASIPRYIFYRTVFEQFFNSTINIATKKIK
jgi:hypothetical protein